MLNFDDHPHDECGVFGIYAPGREVARLAFFALYALQHRGQESAGIATCDGQRTYSHKNMGLVAQVFNEDNLSPLVGHLAIGHTRYSTTGSSKLVNAQPYLIETIYGPLGVAHNGNLTNALQLRQRLLKRGVGLTSTTDSEIVTQILAAPPELWTEEEQTYEQEGDHWVARLRALMEIAEGAYSLTVLTRNALYAIRDPKGLRPLCIGQMEEGYVIASETCALTTIGAEFVREVAPGEIIRIDDTGLSSFKFQHEESRALCVFEYVYFARPDSIMDGQFVHQIRQAMGRKLAEESPAEADIVVAVPDSSIPAAIGYSQQHQLPFTEGLIKNRYIGRTFIQPDDKLRKQGVHLKFNTLTPNLEGQRVILIDDSVVRGNTLGPLVQMLRDSGAAEVHVRVSSPPVRHPCFMGVDMATYKELIAHRLNVPEICEHVGADSLEFLSLSGMLDAIHDVIGHKPGFCSACFSGEYPINIPAWLFDDDREKLIFEESWG